MNVNLNISGELEAYIDSIIRRGLAANKTEAVRMVIARHYEEEEDEWAPFEQMDDERSQHVAAYLQKQYASGKLKTLSMAQFRKNYPHLLK